MVLTKWIKKGKQTDRRHFIEVQVKIHLESVIVWWNSNQWALEAHVGDVLHNLEKRLPRWSGVNLRSYRSCICVLCSNASRMLSLMMLYGAQTVWCCVSSPNTKLFLLTLLRTISHLDKKKDKKKKIMILIKENENGCTCSVRLFRSFCTRRCLY